MEENNNPTKYKIHEIVYTDVRGIRSKAFVSEESGRKALVKLEEELKTIGYLDKDLHRMTPIAKTVGYESNGPWVEFNRFED